MDEQLMVLMDLGRRLLEASPEKFTQVLEALAKVLEVQETLARFDWQLPFRGRPRKRYLA